MQIIDGNGDFNEYWRGNAKFLVKLPSKSNEEKTSSATRPSSSSVESILAPNQLIVGDIVIVVISIVIIVVVDLFVCFSLSLD